VFFDTLTRTLEEEEEEEEGEGVFLTVRGLGQCCRTKWLLLEECS
jgi:hypothetical protein